MSGERSADVLADRQTDTLVAILCSRSSVADLEWAEPAPVLPLLTDRRRHRTPVLNFDRSAVKRALQNTQHDCHQWLSRSFRVHHVLGRDSAPDPAGEAYSAPPDPLAGLRGTLLIRGRGRGDGPPNANSWVCPCNRHINRNIHTYYY